MDNFKRITNQIKQAQEQAKRTTGLNYRKFNEFIINKGLERDKVAKERREKEGDRILGNASREAAYSIHHALRGRKTYT